MSKRVIEIIPGEKPRIVDLDESKKLYEVLKIDGWLKTVAIDYHTVIVIDEDEAWQDLPQNDLATMLAGGRVINGNAYIMYRPVEYCGMNELEGLKDYQLKKYENLLKL